MTLGRFPSNMRPFLLALILPASIRSLPALQDRPTTNPGNPSTAEDFKAGDVHREPFQRATDLLAALGVMRGNWVADVGAGAGYYSMRLADMIGADGKVFAEDISNSSVRWLNNRVKAFHLTNVEVVKGEIDDPKLPADRLDAVLIVDSYHHFTNYAAMLERILYSLKPGGRLVIADYSYAEHRSQPRADQCKLHEIDPELVRTELGRAGFAVVKCEDPFVKWTPGGGNPRANAADLWLIVSIRPR